jgi:hypothetical protein
MNALLAKVTVCGTCLVLGIVGLGHGIEYSGWVLFAGILAVISILDHEDEKDEE